MGGYCNHIEVALLPGNRVRVVDNGRGIPVDIHLVPSKHRVDPLQADHQSIASRGDRNRAGRDECR